MRESTWNEKILRGKDVWGRFVYMIEIVLFLLVVIYKHLGLPIVQDDVVKVICLIIFLKLLSIIGILMAD